MYRDTLELSEVSHRALILCLVCIPLVARAGELECPKRSNPKQDEKLARELFQAALEDEAALPERALERLRCADSLADRPVVALRRGLVSERLGNNAEAADAFTRYLELAGSSAPDREAMEERIRVLRARLESRAKTDSAPRAASSPAPERPKAPGPSRTLGWVGVGVGVAAVVTGSVLLVSAKSDSDAVAGISPSSNTDWTSDDARGRWERAKTKQTVGIIALSVGAVAGGFGTYWLLRSPNKDRIEGFGAAYTVRY